MKNVKGIWDWNLLPCKVRSFLLGAGTTSVEIINGCMMFAVAWTLITQPNTQQLLQIHGDSTDIGMAIAVVSVVNAVLIPILCRAKCRATRGFLLAVSSVVWVGIAASAYAAEPPAYFQSASALLLCVSTVMTFLTVVTGSNNVGEFRKNKE